MIEFEDLLTKLQAEKLTLGQADQSQDKEVLHGLKGKKNQDHIRKFRDISEYLRPYPIEIITDRKAVLAVLFKVKRQHLLGIDIETSKKTDHPKAGLIPKISNIRLIQIFDGERIYIFDCQKIGSVDWMAALRDTRLIAHNAAFEAQHFLHAGITLNKLECSMLECRVAWA